MLENGSAVVCLLLMSMTHTMTPFFLYDIFFVLFIVFAAFVLYFPVCSIVTLFDIKLLHLFHNSTIVCFIIIVLSSSD